LEDGSCQNHFKAKKTNEQLFLRKEIVKDDEGKKEKGRNIESISFQFYLAFREWHEFIVALNPYELQLKHVELLIFLHFEQKMPRNYCWLMPKKTLDCISL